MKRSLNFLGFSFYSVTDNGKVFNEKTKKELKPNASHEKGYLKVTLYNGHTRKAYFVHQLVALAFIDNPEKLDTVDHKNFIVTDNNVDNLQWLSKSDNSARSWTAGNHDKQKKPILKCDDAGNILGSFDCIHSAAKELNVDRSNISRSVSQQRKCKGYFYKAA